MTAQRGDFDRPPVDRVTVSLPADDVAFLRGFDPDRDRTASRADMVRVIEHLQAALADQPVPGTDSSGQAVQRVVRHEVQAAFAEQAKQSRAWP